MKRIQAFEIMDLEKCPKVIRDGETSCIYYSINFSPVYAPVYEKIYNALQVTGMQNIIDLCSGTGGCLLSLSKFLKRKDSGIKIIATDKFPCSYGEALNNHGIKYCSESVDATEVPEHLHGMRTLFTSFHHFSPENAQKILQDAVDKGVPIGIFEYTKRSPIYIIKLLMITFILVLIITLFIRPISLKQLFLTYIVPIIPVVLLFDGIVSCFRSYTLNELKNMVSKLNADNYTWEINEIFSLANMASPITYVIGIPKN